MIFGKKKNSNVDIDDDEEGMGFFEHLEELRWRIIKAVIGVLAGGLVAAYFIDWIMNVVLLRPASLTTPPLELQNIRPYGQFSLYIEVIITCGVILSIPNILYQLWKFIEPALKPSEARYIGKIVVFSSVCFLSGIVFAYYMMLPASLGFFASFGSSQVKNIIAVDEYYDFIISVMIAAGVVFELPMVSFFLSKIGILKPWFMKKYRRHAVVIILLIAGIVTPGPDITSQVLLAVPLIILYEISIWICKASQKKVIDEPELDDLV